MWIDLEITAHLSQKLPADLLFSILKSGKFITEVQTTMASLSFVRHELTSDILLPSPFPHSPIEFRTPHDSMVGHFCPNVKQISAAGRRQSRDRRTRRNQTRRSVFPKRPLNGYDKL